MSTSSLFWFNIVQLFYIFLHIKHCFIHIVSFWHILTSSSSNLFNCRTANQTSSVVLRCSEVMAKTLRRTEERQRNNRLPTTLRIAKRFWEWRNLWPYPTYHDLSLSHCVSLCPCWVNLRLKTQGAAWTQILISDGSSNIKYDQIPWVFLCLVLHLFCIVSNCLGCTVWLLVLFMNVYRHSMSMLHDHSFFWAKDAVPHWMLNASRLAVEGRCSICSDRDLSLEQHHRKRYLKSHLLEIQRLTQCLAGLWTGFWKGFWKHPNVQTSKHST